MIKLIYPNKDGVLHSRVRSIMFRYRTAEHQDKNIWGYLGPLVDTEGVLKAQDYKVGYMTDGEERNLTGLAYRTRDQFSGQVHHLNPILHVKVDGDVMIVPDWYPTRYYDDSGCDLETAEPGVYTHYLLAGLNVPEQSVRFYHDTLYYGVKVQSTVGCMVRTYPLNGEYFAMDWASFRYDFRPSTGLTQFDGVVVHECFSKTRAISKVVTKTGAVFNVPNARVTSTNFNWSKNWVSLNEALAPLLSEYKADMLPFERVLSDGQIGRDAAVARYDASSVEATISSLSAITLLHGNDMLKPLVNYNELAYEAYQNIGMWDGNGIAYIRDAATISVQCRNVARDMQRLVRNLSGRKRKYLAGAISTRAKVVSRLLGLPSILASLFLAYHYGAKLTYLDTKELAERVPEAFPVSNIHRVSASRSAELDGIAGVARYHLYYDPMPLGPLFNSFLEELDLTADLSNMWDLVPYSFIIDWFLKVGDFFAAVDNLNRIQKLNVFGWCCSWKASRDVSGLVRLGVRGVRLELSVYERWAGPRPLIPIPPSDVTVNPVSHMVEAAALVVQRL